MRTTVVSGGTGALGREVVEAFLDRRDRVVVPWIVKSERDELAGMLRHELDQERLVLVEADVSDDPGAAEVARAAGEVDVLVNGVGGFEGGPALHDTELESWDRMYRINLRTAAALTRALLPGMLARRRGTVLCVASAAATSCPPGLGAYSASKAGVIALVQTVQAEVADSGIRVNAVVPTTIDTPANRAAMPDADHAAWTPPRRIAQVLTWLAGDEAAAIRGALIPV